MVPSPPCNLPALLQVCDGLHHVPCLLPGAGPRREARDGNAVPRAVQRPHQGAASIRHQRGKRRLRECLQCSSDITRRVVIAKGAHNRSWSFCGLEPWLRAPSFWVKGALSGGSRSALRSGWGGLPAHLERPGVRAGRDLEPGRSPSECPHLRPWASEFCLKGICSMFPSLRPACCCHGDATEVEVHFPELRRLHSRSPELLWDS